MDNFCENYEQSKWRSSLTKHCNTGRECRVGQRIWTLYPSLPLKLLRTCWGAPIKQLCPNETQSNHRQKHAQNNYRHEQTHPYTHRHTDTDTDRQADRQTDTPTHTHTQIHSLSLSQTHTHTLTNTYTQRACTRVRTLKKSRKQNTCVHARTPTTPPSPTHTNKTSREIVEI